MKLFVLGMILVSGSANAAEICGHVKKLEIVRAVNGNYLHANVTLDNGQTYKTTDALSFLPTLDGRLTVCIREFGEGKFLLTSIEN